MQPASDGASARAMSFKGSIVTNDVLVVGENARIDAEISCGTVVVEGEVNGNIKAKDAVELRRSARVRGAPFRTGPRGRSSE